METIELHHKQEPCVGYWLIDKNTKLVRCEVCGQAVRLDEESENAAWRDRIIGNLAQYLSLQGRKYVP